jgi:hypothetical protein
MRWPEILAAVGLLATPARPAMAKPRWLACKYTDRSGKGAELFHGVRRPAQYGIPARCRHACEGTDTGITFQALRTRFPQFAIT